MHSILHFSRPIKSFRFAKCSSTYQIPKHTSVQPLSTSRAKDEKGDANVQLSGRRIENLRKSYEKKWQENYQNMEAFLKESRQQDPARRYPPYPSDPNLGRWLDANRFLYQRKARGEKVQLSEKRAKLLEDLAINLFPRDVEWEDRFEELCQYIKRHACFPYESDYEDLDSKDRKLHWWAMRQRREYKKFLKQSSTSMNEERIEKLNSIGFCWDEKEANWLARYEELKEYRKYTGDCMVPADYASNQQLANWVSEQRTHYRRFMKGLPSSMTSARIEMLEEQDFVWNAAEEKWRQKFDEYKMHVELNGPAVLPSVMHNSSLRSWIDHQRKLQRKKIKGQPSPLSDEREALLDTLGIPWYDK